MDKETQSAKIRELAASIAPDIKTEQDLANLTRELVKQTVEMALSRELDVPLVLYQTFAIRSQHRQQP